jgi:hypothetical protein
MWLENGTSEVWQTADLDMVLADEKCMFIALKTTIAFKIKSQYCTSYLSDVVQKKHMI